MDKIGLIGIGNIGKFYSKVLIEAGYPLVVMDINSDNVNYAMELGAQSADSPAEIARRSDIIILSLPDSRAVEGVMDGEDGILGSIREGQLVIDTGTSRPETDIKYERLCAEKGAGYLDSPLTFRGPGQILMVGGTAENYRKAEEVLKCISYKIKHIGPVGQGQVLKLINQAYMGSVLAVQAEVVELAKKQGIDPHLLKDFLEFDIQDALYGDDFGEGGNLAIHYKDLGYLLDMAHDSGANIPICSLVHEIFKAAKLNGDAGWKQPGVITYWRRLNK